jgi:WD40 repeat protein
MFLALVAVCLSELIFFSVLRLGSLNADGHVYIWHCPTGTLLEVLPGHQKKAVNSAVWCPTAVMFATCGDDGTVRIWEPEPATIFGEVLRDGTQIGSPVTIEPAHEVAPSR